MIAENSPLTGASVAAAVRLSRRTCRARLRGRPYSARHFLRRLSHFAVLITQLLTQLSITVNRRRQPDVDCAIPHRGMAAVVPQGGLGGSTAPCRSNIPPQSCPCPTAWLSTEREPGAPDAHSSYSTAARRASRPRPPTPMRPHTTAATEADPGRAPPARSLLPNLPVWCPPTAPGARSCARFPPARSHQPAQHPSPRAPTTPWLSAG